MKCDKCGAVTQDSARFCDMCGNPVHPPAPAPQPPRPVMPPPAPPPAYVAPVNAPAVAPHAMQGGYVDSRDRVMTVGGWMGVFLLMMIPLVNFILVLVWAFGGDVNRNKQNFVRAYILLFIILTLVYILLMGLLLLTGAVATDFFAA